MKNFEIPTASIFCCFIALIGILPASADRFALVTDHGRNVLPANYSEITYFGRGLYGCTKIGENRQQLFNKYGWRVPVDLPTGCALKQVICAAGSEASVVKELPADVAIIVSNKMQEGLVDAYGNEVVPVQYESIQHLGNQYFLLKKESGTRDIPEYRFYDFKNKRMSKVPFKSRERYGPPSEGLIPFSSVEKSASAPWGFCDLEHNIVIPAGFGTVDRFVGGKSFVIRAKGTGEFIDKSGRNIAPHIVPATQFVGEYAVAGVPETGLDKLGVVDRDFHFVIEPNYHVLERAAKSMFVAQHFERDRYVALPATGRNIFILPKQVVGIRSWSGDSDVLVCNFDTGAERLNGKPLPDCAFNNVGEMIIPPEYIIGQTISNLIEVTSCSNLPNPPNGVMNIKGEFVIPMQPSRFYITESDRLVKNFLTMHFDSKRWHSSVSWNRDEELAHFLNDYDLIGMSQSQVEKLLGPVDGPCAYELNGTFRVEIEFECRRVKKWRLSASGGHNPWITENMIFAKDVEPINHQLVPK
jgi:WG containing repeat